MIKNNLKNDSIQLFLEGIKAVESDQLLENQFVIEKNKLIVSDIHGFSKKYNLDEFEKIYVVGAGKASAAMANKIEKILDDKINYGFVVTKYGFGLGLKVIKQFEAGHPLPDENAIIAANEIINLCEQACENDLIISLISGGASALLSSPVSSISLEDKIQTTQILLNSGATISEMNTVRKHISETKGGKLMQSAFPATVISLIVSDVIGDDHSIIGSGPFVHDNSTFSDCINILNKYNLINIIPSSVLQYLTEGENKNRPETPTEENQIFSNSNNFLVGNNLICLKKIRDTAQEMGYNSKILQAELSGEARVIGSNIISDAINFLKHGAEVGKKYCLIYGGESTVTILGSGKGGRNQEMVLSAALQVSGHNGISMLSCGSDGDDGPTDAAGAYCDWTTYKRGEKLGMSAENYLSENDSYNYFKNLEDLIITGTIKTNVMDIQIILINPS